jgi:hypothetical protein
MAYQLGSWNVPGSSTVPVFMIPALCNITFYNIGVQQVYLGTTPQVSSANGLVCHSIPTSFFTYVGSRGTQIYATTGNATAGTLNFVLVSDQ